MPTKKKNRKVIILVILAIWGIIMMLVAAASSATAMNPKLNIFTALLNAPNRIISMGTKAFSPSSASFPSNAFLFSLIYWGAILLIYMNERRNASPLAGKESGSAEWNTDISGYNKTFTSPYGLPTADGKNAILTKDIFMGMDGRKTQRNLNTLVIGGSGTGKSRFYVKPNLLQSGTDCNFVVTDPSGELLKSCGTFLEDNGYKISVLNLTNMEASYCYNPFDYIRREEDILILINCLIKNTTPPGSSSKGDFWEKSETALLTAIFFYLMYHRPEQDRNVASVMRLLRAANIDEEDSSSQSQLDKIFEDIGAQDPEDLGYKSYKTFRMGAGKTLKSILISAAVRLNPFEIPSVAAMVRHDFDHPERNIDLKAIACSDQKQALFCILPQADDTYNFIVSMLYYQLFESLYYYAEHNEGGLKYPVRFLLDEFCNVGQIPEFDKKLATMRKYGLSCSIICQNKKQLEEMYGKKTEGIIGNCDETLFLGSPEPDTQKYISERLGKTTIRARGTSRSYGRSGSSSQSLNPTARDLMTPDEIGRMPDTDCILFVRGVRPFYGPKYDYLKHPNYKYTGDSDPSKIYDIDKKMRDMSLDTEAMYDSEVFLHDDIMPNSVKKKTL